MEKELFERMEGLRQVVLEKGQKTRDRLKIPLYLIWEAPEGILRFQIIEDFKKKYKLYDALAMWLGQKQFWSEKENLYLISLAEKYCSVKLDIKGDD